MKGVGSRQIKSSFIFPGVVWPSDCRGLWAVQLYVAVHGWDVNTGIHSCQHCSEVKLPKLWESPSKGGKYLKHRKGKRGGGKKAWSWNICGRSQIMVRGDSLSVVEIKATAQPWSRLHSQLHPQLQQGQTNPPGAEQNKPIPGQGFSSMMRKTSGDTSGQL